jgi:hypothetical protein
VRVVVWDFEPGGRYQGLPIEAKNIRILAVHLPNKETTSGKRRQVRRRGRGGRRRQLPILRDGLGAAEAGKRFEPVRVALFPFSSTALYQVNHSRIESTSPGND